ncbi:hypothetical protein R6Q59_006429 [Mikania micrantha]
MWMVMLVMMVFTRTRLAEDSQATTSQSIAKGIASTLKPQSKRKRKRQPAVEQPAVEQPAVEQPALEQPAMEQPALEQPALEQHDNPPKRRGPSLNKSVAKIVSTGCKIPLIMDANIKKFVGNSATKFSTECGIIIRNVCPMKFHTWDSAPEDVKNLMNEKLEGKFELLRANIVFMEYVNAQLRDNWKRARGALSNHWKTNGGKMNPVNARSKMKPGCRSVEDWNHLCDYWESDKFRKYSDQMEINRGKQVNISRGGSRSISNHVFQMINPETQMPPSPLQVYYNLHYKDKKGWLNEHAKAEYENIIAHKKEAIDKLTSEGTTVTTSMERKLEKEAIKSVCGKDKTIQSGWEVCVGPVMKKKDAWMKSIAEPSQGEATTREANEDLKNQINELKEQNERMSDFLLAKFPDFEIIISKSVNDDATGSDGLSGNSYSTT